MTAKHSAATLAALITSRIESDMPDRVMAALRPYDGKNITTRLLDGLPGGRLDWRMSRNHGWTEIKNKAYITSQGHDPEGLSLIVVRSEASEPLDCAWVERENPAYFSGRRERNAKRAAALLDTATLTRLAFVMNEIEDLHGKLAFATAQFKTFTDYGAPLDADRYELERACGLRQDT